MATDEPHSPRLSSSPRSLLISNTFETSPMTVSIQDAVANEGDSPGLSSQNTYLSTIPRRQRAQSEVVLDRVFWI